MRAAITATGHYLPPDVYPNAYFEQQLDTTDAWIRSRTGIAERHFASAGGTSDLIVPAAERCLDARGVSATTVDCIIVATMTPDRPCPSTAAIVQRKLGSTHAWGFDLAGACSGFVYGLIVASKLVESGAAPLWGGSDEQCGGSRGPRDRFIWTGKGSRPSTSLPGGASSRPAPIQSPSDGTTSCRTGRPCSRPPWLAWRT